MRTAEEVWNEILEEDYIEIEDEFVEEEFVEEDSITEPINEACEIVSKKGSESELFRGKQFNSLKEAELFYVDFASTRGYSIRKRKRYMRGRGQEVTGYMFTCNREGYYRPKENNVEDNSIKRNRSYVRKDCTARMSIHRLRDTEIWEVKTFSDDHCHDLVSPSKQVLLRSNRKISAAARKLTECFNLENIPVSKVPAMFGDPSLLQFNSRTCYNHMRDVRDKYNEDGDAEGVLAFFEDKKAENPHFYYAIDVDDKQRAVNFFWVDGRARSSYEQFGDVVIFDTTYKKNKYHMPFAPFTGINHHQQSILFGCALLANEVEETFTWVFEKWLDAMGGKAPISIVTDQDKAMQKAIAKVLPNTRHRFCLWHIMKKFAEKMANVYSKNVSFGDAVSKCLYKSYTNTDFEDKWMALVREYGLEDNHWLADLYSIRESWVPTYNRGTFFAGTRTTQRSESMNHYFDGFVTHKTNLQTFVRKYEQALARVYERERDEDYVSIHMERVLKSKDPLLEHAAQVYTRKMFDKFAKQFEYVCRLRADMDEVNVDVTVYKVRWWVGSTVEFRVIFDNISQSGSCSCRKYEFSGMPCKHLLKVFDRLQIDEIPPYFIMKRWTKKANEGRVNSSGGASEGTDTGTVASRTSILSRFSIQIACVAGRTEEGYTMLYEVLENAYSKVKELDDSLFHKEQANAPMVQSSMSTVEGPTILNPNVSQTKGRKKATRDNDKGCEGTNKRFKSGIEISQCKRGKTKEKGGRKCAICGGINVKHDARNCPLKQKENEDHGDAVRLDRDDLQMEFVGGEA